MLVHAFGFTQKGVAVFALLGVAGAIVAPLAGKFADRGFSRQASLAAFGGAILSFALSHYCPESGWGALVLLAIAANLLDAGVSAHLVLGQRAIFMIDPNNQSRLNGLYIATIYVGGSLGSALGACAYLHGGWGYSTAIGLLFPLAAMILMLTERITGYGELY
jgi:predicted MFS family arabinose efflux permease